MTFTQTNNYNHSYIWKRYGWIFMGRKQKPINEKKNEKKTKKKTWDFKLLNHLL